MLCATVNAVMVLTSYQPPPNDQRQAKDKNQMVDPGEDVVKAQKQVFSPNGKGAARTFDDHRGRSRTQKLGLTGAIGKLDPDQHFGAGFGQTVD